MTTYLDGNTVKEKPVGGSESALFYLSRELAKLGHKVTIFNNCGDNGGIYEGVEYINWSDSFKKVINHSKKNKYDIFVAFRDLPALLYPIKAKKKIWWGHDDFSNVWKFKRFLKLVGWLTERKCDKLFVVSNFLAQICNEKLGIPYKKLFIARNGIYLPYFMEDIPRNRFRLAYSSNPVRGLDLINKIFPKIKEKIPQAEMHVFCNEEFAALNDAHKKEAQEIFKGAHQAGIIIRGAQTHENLAKELMQCGLWLYPSHPVPSRGFFAETSCIAALEAQAAGTPPIASSRGGLVETIKDQETGILIKGDPTSEIYQEEFINQTVNLLKNENRWKAFSEAAKKHALENNSWEVIAKEWEKELEKLVV